MWQLLKSNNLRLHNLLAPYFRRTETGPFVCETDRNLMYYFQRLEKPNDAPSIKLTNEKVHLVPRSNHDWIADPSIIALRSFTATLIETSHTLFSETGLRKYGQAPKCTHYVETADLAVNLGSHIKLPVEVIAFAAYAHDLVEDFRKLGVSADVIVDQCWRGDKKHRKLLIETINALTDDEKLKGRERHLEQIRVAKADGTGLVGHIRFCDKLNSLVRDYSTLISGEMPFGDEKKFREYFIQRKEVVEELNVSPRLKRWYGRLLSKVNAALNEYSKYGHVNASRNDLLDTINYTSRSPSDGLRLTRKTLGALAP